MKSELRKMGMDEIKLKNIVTRGLESLFLYLKRTELIVASGLLSWGHFISSTIIDLIAQILLTELSWTMPLLNSIMKCIQQIIEC